MAIPKALVTSVAVSEASIDQPRPAVVIEDHAAVDLAFPGRMLGDVDDPQLVRAAAGRTDAIRRLFGPGPALAAPPSAWGPGS